MPRNPRLGFRGCVFRRAPSQVALCSAMSLSLLRSHPSLVGRVAHRAAPRGRPAGSEAVEAVTSSPFSNQLGLCMLPTLLAGI
jgi:hypothetical protein